VKVTVHPSQLKGSISAPASKSSMQRACAAAILKKGDFIIHNPGHSNDDKVALGLIQALGATVQKQNDAILIHSEGILAAKQLANPIISCGESGLSIRMFTPLFAILDQEIIINGTGSLLSRTMSFFDEVLPKLGVSIKSNNGKLPLIIRGPLRPTAIEVDGSLSSQYLTGLLMAYTAAGAKNITLKVKNLKSKPYADLTLDVMRQFGLPLPENKKYEAFTFHGNREVKHAPEPVNYTVEGDWSGGAFLLVAGAIAGPIMIRGLDVTSSQADKAVLQVLMDANAGIAVEAKGIKIHPSSLNGFEFDASDCPDLFPPLAVLAAYCKGKSVIKGSSRLINKESNRALTLQEELGKMGIKIELKNDEMIIRGGNKIRGTTVHSHHDHRIAMACGVAALKAEGETIIENAEAVGKSYPGFFNDLKFLGASVSLPYQEIHL
jgi:3-phosphoshikimate 1-carboxyvinyltransferase